MSQTKIEKRNTDMNLNGFKGMFSVNMKQYTMFLALIALGIVFNILTGGTFLESRNLSNLLLQTASIAIVACGMLLVVIAGHIDLSVGSVAGFTGAIAAYLQVKCGWGTPEVILLAIFIGLLIGVWQGFWVAYQGLPAFVVSLGGMLIFRGGVIGVTNGETIAPLRPAFKALGQGYLPGLISKSGAFNDTTLILGIITIAAYLFIEIRRRNIRVKKYNLKVLPLSLQILKMAVVSAILALFFSIMIFYRGMPYCILLLIGIIIVFLIITTKTTFGRHIYAIGGNKEAAKLSGINYNKVCMFIFIISGIMASVSGLVFTARLNSATASAGNLFELDACASCFIGGASPMGGVGTVLGAMIGALIMATINNGMSLMNVNIKYQYIVKGLIVILAVWADILNRRKNA